MFDLKVLEKGIPDDAYKPLTGDDKEVAQRAQEAQQAEREGQETLGLFRAAEDLATAEAGIARAARELEALEDDSPAGVPSKGGATMSSARCTPTSGACAGLRPLDRGVLRQAEEAVQARPSASRPPTTCSGRCATSPAIQGVHADGARAWPRSTASSTGRSSSPRSSPPAASTWLLGNPPWERIKLQEEEFFAARDPEIANARQQGGAPAG